MVGNSVRNYCNFYLSLEPTTFTTPELNVVLTPFMLHLLLVSPAQPVMVHIRSPFPVAMRMMLILDMLCECALSKIVEHGLMFISTYTGSGTFF